MVSAPKNILLIWSPLLGTILGYFRSILDMQCIPQFLGNHLIFLMKFFTNILGIALMVNCSHSLSLCWGPFWHIFLAHVPLFLRIHQHFLMKFCRDVFGITLMVAIDSLHVF